MDLELLDRYIAGAEAAMQQAERSWLRAEGGLMALKQLRDQLEAEAELSQMAEAAQD